MKSVIAAVLFSVLSVPAFANTTYVMPEGSKALQLVEGQLVSVTSQAPKCPAGAVCELYSVARISFTMPGCLDELGPVTVQQSIAEDGKIDLYVTAFAIPTKKSLTAFCIAPNIKYVNTALGFGFVPAENVRIHSATGIYSVNK